jgi:predicted GTPase
MHLASRALASGASFKLLGHAATFLHSSKPVVAVVASRTGAGKSQTSRRVVGALRAAGLRVLSFFRHPMPYGNLLEQRVQRFASVPDLAAHTCSIEEMEEYEPHLGLDVVYAGVDYAAIVRAAEAEADVIVWDGGNNDEPFIKPDLWVTVLDPHRAGDELRYHPGEVNLRCADVCVINKMDSADGAAIQRVRDSIAQVNPRAVVIDAASPFSVSDPALIRGKRVLVVEDGPTLTHGEMRLGCGVMAARKFGAKELIDPRPFLHGSLKDTFAKYPDIGALLPAMGYGPQQTRDLEATIRACGADAVVIATPIDLRRVVSIDAPCVRVTYELQELGRPTLADVLAGVIAKAGEVAKAGTSAGAKAGELGIAKA